MIAFPANADVEYSRDFYNRGNEIKKVEKLPPATLLAQEGLNYSGDVLYLDNPCPDYVEGCVEITIKRHKLEPTISVQDMEMISTFQQDDQETLLAVENEDGFRNINN